MSELEIFARDWEAHERSRHARLIEELKREVQAAPKPASVEAAIDAPYSLRLPPVASRSQMKANGRHGASRYQKNRPPA